MMFILTTSVLILRMVMFVPHLTGIKQQLVPFSIKGQCMPQLFAKSTYSDEERS